MNKKDDKGSILLTQDNFNPELFLSVVHKDTSYSQLRVRDVCETTMMSVGWIQEFRKEVEEQNRTTEDSCAR